MILTPELGRVDQRARARPVTCSCTSTSLGARAEPARYSLCRTVPEHRRATRKLAPGEPDDDVAEHAGFFVYEHRHVHVHVYEHGSTESNRGIRCLRRRVWFLGTCRRGGRRTVSDVLS